MTIADLTPKERLAVRNLKVLMALWPQSLRVSIDDARVIVFKRTEPYMSIQVDCYPSPNLDRPASAVPTI